MAATTSPPANIPEPTFDSPPPVGSTLTAITKHADGGFEMIIALSKVTINDNAVMEIFGRIQTQAVNYWDTIERSSAMATEGYSTSDAAIDVCTQLGGLDPVKEAEVIQELIDDLKGSTQKCLKSCKEADEMFSKLIESFAKISRDVQAKIEAEITSGFTVKGIFRGRLREVKLSELGDELQEVATKLLDLSDAIKELANWWTSVTMALTSVVSATDKVKASKAMRGKVGKIQESWTRIKNDFETYNRDITNLRSTYPRDTLIASNSEGTQAK